MSECVPKLCGEGEMTGVEDWRSGIKSILKNTFSTGRSGKVVVYLQTSAREAEI